MNNKALNIYSRAPAVKPRGHLHAKKGYARMAAMGFLQAWLPLAQIIIAVLLMASVLLQRTGASLGGAFGADNFGSAFHTRRGLEKTLFNATIALGILLALSALLALAL